MPRQREVHGAQSLKRKSDRLLAIEDGALISPDH